MLVKQTFSASVHTVEGMPFTQASDAHIRQQRICYLGCITILKQVKVKKVEHSKRREETCKSMKFENCFTSQIIT